MSKAAKHVIRHESKKYDECEYGCHSYFNHFAVCSCGWRKKINDDFSSLKEESTLLPYELLHRVEMLERKDAV